jgi:predicted DNA-binding transcriptional regulator AlpA
MAERLLRVPEVARELGIDGVEVYGLIDAGTLEAGKDAAGLVSVPESAVRAYQREHSAAIADK